MHCVFNDVRVNMCSFQEHTQLKFYGINIDDFKVICDRRCEFNNIKFQ